MRQTWVQYPGAALGGQAGHYPTLAVKGMSYGVVRKDTLFFWASFHFFWAWTLFMDLTTILLEMVAVFWTSHPPAGPAHPPAGPGPSPNHTPFG